MHSVIYLKNDNFVQSSILDQQVEHNYHTRTTDLHLPAVKLNKFKQSIIYESTFYWNELKDVVQWDKGIHTFIKKIKFYL